MAAQVGVASGDSGELLEQDFLAECMEGQVSPDVGANGSNLGKGGERWEGTGKEKTGESWLQTVEGSARSTGSRWSARSFSLRK